MSGAASPRERERRGGKNLGRGGRDKEGGKGRNITLPFPSLPWEGREV